MSFWSDWLLISGGANPNYGSTATTDPNEISAFKTLTTAVTRHATSIDKLSSAKRIAVLKAGIDVSKMNASTLAKLAAIEGSIKETKIKEVSDVQQTLIKSWTGYFGKANTVYTPVMSKVAAGFAGSGNVNRGAWGSLAGSFFQDGVSFSQSKPEFLATFRTINDKYGQPFDIDDQTGLIARNPDGTFKLNPGSKAALGDQQTIANVLEIAENYQDTQTSKNQVLTNLNEVGQKIRAAEASLKSKDPNAANIELDGAIEALKGVNADATKLAGINVETDQETIQSYKDADKEYRDIKEAWEISRDRIFGDAGGEEEKWKAVVSSTQYQQWAKDRGYAIGYVNEQDNYVAGAHDEKAIVNWYKESKKPPGKYRLGTRVVTDELIQVVDGEGNVLGKGYRMASHASDRDGSVGLIAPGNKRMFFTKAQIGQVQLLDAPPETRPSFAGSARASQRAEAALADIGGDLDISATKEAEKVNETQYAVVQDEMGKSSYLTREEYEARKAALSPVEMVTLGGKRYLTSGDQVFELGQNDDGSISLIPAEVAVDVPDTRLIKAVQAVETRFTPTKADGSAFVITDLMDGDKPKASLEKGLIQGVARTEEDIAAAKALNVPSGVTLTETPRPTISGTESDVGGTVYADVRGSIPATESTVPPGTLEEAREAAEALKEADTGPVDASVFDGPGPDQNDLLGDDEAPTETEIDAFEATGEGEEVEEVEDDEKVEVGTTQTKVEDETYGEKQDRAAGEDPASKLINLAKSAQGKIARLDKVRDRIKKRRETDPDFGKRDSWPKDKSGKSVPPRLIAKGLGLYSEIAQTAKDMGIDSNDERFTTTSPDATDDLIGVGPDVAVTNYLRTQPGALVPDTSEPKETGVDSTEVTPDPTATTTKPPSDEPKVTTSKKKERKPKKTRQPKPAQTVRGVLRPDEKTEPGFFKRIGQVFRDRQGIREERQKPVEPRSPTPALTPGETDLTTGKEVEAAKQVTAGEGMDETLQENRELRKRAAQIKAKKEAAGQPAGGTP